MNFRPLVTMAKCAAFFAIISLASCKKDGTTGSNDNNAANLSDSSTAADNMYYDVLNNAFVGFEDNISVWSSSAPRGMQNATLSTGTVASTPLGCAIYTIDDSIPDSYPKTLTLDFGTGCTSADGILRKGKLTYVFTAPILVPGATATVTFDHYEVSGYKLQGAYSITNNSSEVNGISITTQVTNGIITYPSGTNYHYAHNKTYTLTAGSSTPYNMADDIWSVTGNSSISVPGGSSIVFTTQTPLVKAVICHNVSAGIVSFVYDNSVSGTIDFGNGDCDNQAVVKVGNIEKTITLW